MITDVETKALTKQKGESDGQFKLRIHEARNYLDSRDWVVSYEESDYTESQGKYFFDVKYDVVKRKQQNGTLGIS